MSDHRFDPSEHPHRRFNALTGDWVLVSPHRAKRPWQGAVEDPLPISHVAHDPNCYLCPGNNRIGGETNPAYDDVFIFTNDFAALQPDTPATDATDSALFQSVPEQGTCRVVCYSPDHSKTLARMTKPDVLRVVKAWGEQVAELSQPYRWVQVFENRGDAMGCSNPHPHGQIWAQSSLSTLAVAEDTQQANYLDQHNSNLLLDYAQRELEQQVRVVCSNEHWLAVVPYWAAWPFETLVLPTQRQIGHLHQLTDSEQTTLAAILSELCIRYDNLFQCAFPYSMGWHGQPFGETDSANHWQLHAHFLPPLLRSATVKKFMVGYELLNEAQRDLTPEQAAARLREQPTVHYSEAQP